MGAELGLAVQVAKGTTAPAATHRVAIAGGTLPAPVKLAEAENALTTTRVVRDPYVAAVRVEGSPVVAVRSNITGLLLYAVLGAEAVSGAADPWTHDITLGAQPPWLTVWRSVGSVIHERFPDCRIASLEIVSAAGKLLHLSFRILGLRAEHQTAGQVAPIDTSDVFVHAHAEGGLVVEGVPVASISDWRLRIDTGATFTDSLAGPHISTPPKVDVRLEVRQLAVTDAALWNRIHYGSASPANGAPATLIPLESATVEFTVTEAASPERSLRITIPRPVVEALAGYAPDVASRPLDRLVVYRAYRPAAGSPITARLRNSIPTTYAAQTPASPITHSGAAALTGRATLAAATTATQGASANLVGIGAISAAATQPEARLGSAALTGLAFVVAAGTVDGSTAAAIDTGTTGLLGHPASQPANLVPGDPFDEVPEP